MILTESPNPLHDPTGPMQLSAKVAQELRGIGPLASATSFSPPSGSGHRHFERISADSNFLVMVAENNSYDHDQT